MSNSRLEKFIYAICGMEVDDLPTPLSRIETLWNCLITGEVPDFEPLSRNEKYLMAMLNGDVDGLPEPTSRSEKLLYKIATGETDLSDVPGYLSRYEELLKQLIENGGIGGTDFEYVLYTLNQPLSTLYTTAEGPVKSAILKGQTKLIDELGNECDHPNRPNAVIGAYISASTGEEVLTNTSCRTTYIKAPHETFKIRGKNRWKKLAFYDVNKQLIKTLDPALNSYDDYVVNSTLIPSNAEYMRVSGSISPINSGDVLESVLEILDVNNSSLYNTQLRSCKMPVLTTTGKNLYPSNNSLDCNKSSKHYLLENYFESNSQYVTQATFELTTKNGKWTPIIGYEYTDGSTSEEYFELREENEVGTILSRSFISAKGKTVSKIYIRSPWGVYGVFSNIQIEKGTQATSYEPYKSNILTTTSKNLFDMNRPYDAITDSQATVVQDTNQITVSSAESGIYVNANFILDKDFFAGKTVTGSCLYESDENDIGTVQIAYQDGNGEHHYQWIKTPKTFTFPNSFIGDVMLSVSANNTDTPQSNTVTVKNIQLELGSTATPYEPYSEVVLRGIGDVKDTLDGNTGELTQRIGEIMLDGSENWNTFQTPSSSPNHAFTQLSMPQLKTGGVLSENFPCHTRDLWGTELEGFYVNAHNKLQFNVQKSKLSEVSLNGLKNYIRDNSFVLSCVLNENVVKTVVLSITDQDGQPTKLSTFNDITHVSIEAEDLLPTVDLEVPTKIEETLSTLPTLMNDISETQQLLNESIDDQAENIKEVSTAMIEIRNDIL